MVQMCDLTSVEKQKLWSLRTNCDVCHTPAPHVETGGNCATHLGKEHPISKTFEAVSN